MPETNVAMERRPRPIRHTFSHTVLHGIDANVIDMPRHVGFVANLMLPESSLPNAISPLAFAIKTTPRARNMRTKLDLIPRHRLE